VPTIAKTDEEFDALMQQVLNGSEEAARELFRDYEPYLLYAIRRKLSKRLRSRFDSMDFSQDVWASYFAQPVRKRMFATKNELLAFLTRLAQNKVIDATRRRLAAQKYNVNREQSIHDSRFFDKDRLTADQPTPSQILMSKEEWRRFLHRVPLVYRRIFILLRQGLSKEEIAEKMDLHVRTVRRIANRFLPEPPA